MANEQEMSRGCERRLRRIMKKEPAFMGALSLVELELKAGQKRMREALKLLKKAICEEDIEMALIAAFGQGGN